MADTADVLRPRALMLPFWWRQYIISLRVHGTMVWKEDPPRSRARDAIVWFIAKSITKISFGNIKNKWFRVYFEKTALSVCSFGIILEDDDLLFPLLGGPAVTLNLFFKFSGAFASEKSLTMMSDSEVDKQRRF